MTVKKNFFPRIWSRKWKSLLVPTHRGAPTKKEQSSPWRPELATLTAGPWSCGQRMSPAVLPLSLTSSTEPHQPRPLPLWRSRQRHDHSVIASAQDNNKSIVQTTKLTDISLFWLMGNCCFCFVITNYSLVPFILMWIIKISNHKITLLPSSIQFKAEPRLLEPSPKHRPQAQTWY